MNRRDALRTLSGTTLVALGGAGLIASQCVPVDAPAAEPDPLLALITSCRDGLALFNATTGLTPEEDAALQAATWDGPFDRLCSDPPAATTLAGALAGIRLVIDEEEECGSQPDLTVNVLRAALAFFEGRA